MAMDAAAVAQLAVEGIINIQDLADFDEDSLKQVADNLRRPSGRIADPNVGAVAGATIPNPSLRVWSKDTNEAFGCNGPCAVL